MNSDRILGWHFENDGGTAPAKGETHIHGMNTDEVNAVVSGRVAQVNEKHAAEVDGLKATHAEEVGKLNEQIAQFEKGKKESDAAIADGGKKLEGYDALKLKVKTLETEGMLRDIGVNPDNVEDARILGESKGWFKPEEGKDAIDKDALKESLTEKYPTWMGAQEASKGSPGSTSSGGKTQTLSEAEQIKADATRRFGGE